MSPNQGQVATNPLESIFSGVRSRADTAKRLRRQDNPLCPVFKLVERLSGHWRAPNGGANLMALALAQCNFKDGILQRREARQLASVAA